MNNNLSSKEGTMKKLENMFDVQEGSGRQWRSPGASTPKSLPSTFPRDDRRQVQFDMLRTNLGRKNKTFRSLPRMLRVSTAVGAP